MKKQIVHHLKVEQEHYQAVVKGEKSFEARIDDRDPKFAIAHFLVLHELAATGYQTGRATSQKVTYVLRGERWGIKHGYVILGIKPSSIPKNGLHGSI